MTQVVAISSIREDNGVLVLFSRFNQVRSLIFFTSASPIYMNIKFSFFTLYFTSDYQSKPYSVFLTKHLEQNTISWRYTHIKLYEP